MIAVFVANAVESDLDSDAGERIEPASTVKRSAVLLLIIIINVFDVAPYVDV